MKDKPKIALVYDRVNTPFGGAEKVLVALHDLFPDAPLYTSVYDPSKTSWTKEWKVVPSFLQHIPFAKQFHRLFVGCMPIAFESLDLSEFDIVISVTSAEAKGILTTPKQLHICYLLTPTRYLWSHSQEYQEHWLTGSIRKYIFDYLRWWDLAAAWRPDVIIPISKLVARRCEEYYLRKPESVIYPTIGETPKEKDQLSEDILLPEIRPFADHYFLIVARLVPYKKIDLAIRACQQTGKTLVIIGQGPDLQRLKKLAKETGGAPNATAKIFFLQAVHADQLPAYYHYCRAFLAPAEEDFGMTVIEAQRFGKPVITYAESGGAEVVEEGIGGVHFFAQTVDDLSEAMHIVESHTWDIEQIRTQAMKYNQENFKHEFKKAVEDHWKSFSQEER